MFPGAHAGFLRNYPKSSCYWSTRLHSFLSRKLRNICDRDLHCILKRIANLLRNIGIRIVSQKETRSGRGFSSVDGAVGAPGGAEVRLSAGSEDFKGALRIRYYAYDALSELTHVAGSKPSSYAEGAFSDYHLGKTAYDVANEMGTGIKNLKLRLPTVDPKDDPFGRWSDFYHGIQKIFCKRDF